MILSLIPEVSFGSCGKIYEGLKKINKKAKTLDIMLHVYACEWSNIAERSQCQLKFKSAPFKTNPKLRCCLVLFRPLPKNNSTSERMNRPAICVSVQGRMQNIPRSKERWRLWWPNKACNCPSRRTNHLEWMEKSKLLLNSHYFHYNTFPRLITELHCNAL